MVHVILLFLFLINVGSIIYLCVELLFELFTVTSFGHNNRDVRRSCAWRDWSCNTGRMLSHPPWTPHPHAYKTNRWHLTWLTLYWLTWSNKGRMHGCFFLGSTALHSIVQQGRPTWANSTTSACGLQTPWGWRGCPASQRSLHGHLCHSSGHKDPTAIALPWYGRFTAAPLRLVFFAGNVQICFVQYFISTLSVFYFFLLHIFGLMSVCCLPYRWGYEWWRNAQI